MLKQKIDYVSKREKLRERAWPCQHHQLYFERGPAVLFWGEGPQAKRGRQRRCNRMERRVRWGAGAGQGVTSSWGTKGPLVQALRGLDGRLEGWQACWWMYKWTRLFSHIPHQTTFSLLSPLAEYPSLSRLPANNRHRDALRRLKMGGGHIWGGVRYTASPSLYLKDS